MHLRPGMARRNARKRTNSQGFRPNGGSGYFGFTLRSMPNLQINFNSKRQLERKRPGSNPAPNDPSKPSRIELKNILDRLGLDIL